LSSRVTCSAGAMGWTNWASRLVPCRRWAPQRYTKWVPIDVQAASPAVRPSILVWPDQISPDELIAVSRRAEDTGFDVVWNVETDFDSFVYDQAVAMGTSRIRTGSGISRSYKRHPLLVAEAASTIDRFAPGRFIIGLGTGPAQRADPALKLQRWGSESDRPVARLEEYIKVIRLALSGERVNFEGEFFAVEDVRLEHVPSSDVPIYLAAGGPQLGRLAGRVADGAFLYFLGDSRSREAVDRIRMAAEKVGRDPTDVEISGLIPTCIGPDREAARRALRRHLFFPYLSLPYYQNLLAAEGYGDVAERIRERLADDDLDGAADSIPDGALDGIAIGGTPSDCEPRLAEFVKRGYDVPVLYPFPVDGDWTAGYQEAIDLFAITPQEVRTQ
jgi:alkanesulfonate monooxygenase SsuD/methylene tetrahydromethanopterin reductase-like flavin-dependent oxidoreductase (luciferase family)